MTSFSSLTDKNKKNTNESGHNFSPLLLLLLLLLLLHHLLQHLLLVGPMDFVRYETTRSRNNLFSFIRVSSLLLSLLQLVPTEQLKITDCSKHYICMVRTRAFFLNIAYGRKKLMVRTTVFSKRTLSKKHYICLKVNCTWTVHELYKNPRYSSCMVHVWFKYGSSTVQVQSMYISCTVQIKCWYSSIRLLWGSRGWRNYPLHLLWIDPVHWNKLKHAIDDYHYFDPKKSKAILLKSLSLI